MQFWRACRNFFHIRPQTFHSRSKKDGKKPAIFSKKNSSQCFDGLVKYCFDKPADFFFGKKRKTFRSMSGSDWKKFFFIPKKSIFPQKSLPTLRMQFWQTHQRKLNKTQKKKFNVQKWKFSPEKISSKFSNCYEKCRFDNSAEKLLTKSHNFIAERPNNVRNFFNLNFFFIKLFQWTPRMLFWQPL